MSRFTTQSSVLPSRHRWRRAAVVRGGRNQLSPVWHTRCSFFFTVHALRSDVIAPDTPLAIGQTPGDHPVGVGGVSDDGSRSRALRPARCPAPVPSGLLLPYVSQAPYHRR